jgi:hypothetical protein
MDSKAIEERLVDLEIGEEIAYSELSELIGRDVTSERGALNSARRRLVRDHQMVFGVIRGVGLKRLDDAEIVGTGESVNDHIRRTARRAARQIACVRDFEAMPPEKRTQHNTWLSLFGAIASVTRAPCVKRLAAAVEQSRASLPLMKTLQSFTEKKRA